MSLSAAWFDGTGPPDYTDIRCDVDYSGASSSSSTSGSYIQYTYHPCGWLIFLPNKAQGSANIKNPEYGYIYAKKDSDSSEKALPYVQHYLRSAPAVSRASGEYMVRTFDREDATDSYIIITKATGGSDTCSVYHYQPYAWYGRVGQVIAAILLHQGVDPDHIDTDAFSDADDGQAAIGSSDDEEPFVFYRREIGQTLGETIKALSTHCWDVLSINLAGKVSLTRRDSSTHTVASLAKSDGVVSVQWRYAFELVINTGWVCEGRYYDPTYTTLGTFSDIVLTCSEVGFPSKMLSPNNKPFEEFTDSTSVTKFGQRPIGKRNMDILQDNEVQSIRYHHLPYLCNVESTTGDPMAAKAELVARYEDIDSQLRREVTVVQDLRGLDYDVGHSVLDVAVTDDGETIDRMTCIRKTVDFRDLSVTSVLLEEPS